MKNQETITAAKITSEYIQGQAVSVETKVETAQAAADAYMNDLKQRKAALEKQTTEYTAQLETAKKQRKVLAGRINDFSSRGMIDEAAEVDAELEKLDRSIATMERKLRLINTAELKGDPTLYRAAADANTAMLDSQTLYRQQMRDLTVVIDTELDRLDKVKKVLEDAIRHDHCYYAGNAFVKIDRHYKDLDRIEKEAAEKAAAERKAQQEASKHTRYVFAP